MAKKILLCGLPGSGKTTFGRRLAAALQCRLVDGDDIRVKTKNLDFSMRGRLRQAEAMAEECEKERGLVVASFVCPQAVTREEFGADFVIWMNTIRHSRFPDTDAIFVPPAQPDLIISHPIPALEADWINQVNRCVQAIRNQIPQGVMIGRYQPFHAGHKALFLEVLGRTGFVGIGVRDMPLSQQRNNPLCFDGVTEAIHSTLYEYPNCYHVFQVPNVAGVYWGRDVGYATGKIDLPADIEAISATAIRERVRKEAAAARKR